VCRQSRQDGWPGLLIRRSRVRKWVPALAFLARAGTTTAENKRSEARNPMPPGHEKKSLPTLRSPAPAPPRRASNTDNCSSATARGDSTSSRFTGLRCMYHNFSTRFFSLHTLKAQERGTHCLGMGKKNHKGRATRPIPWARKDFDFKSACFCAVALTCHRQ
jgi:hypothetical protein